MLLHSKKYCKGDLFCLYNIPIGHLYYLYFLLRMKSSALETSFVKISKKGFAYVGRQFTKHFHYYVYTAIIRATTRGHYFTII